eukprot:Seg142.1 transcript_id=Seg142.1/GoldUCD/mRNA.D3Y31 product="Phospholipase DDHD1" protein_id=Seg142.1/GoldUCD/D3Y31
MEEENQPEKPPEPKAAPVRPPPPKNLRSAHSVDNTTDEKIPPKRPDPPSQTDSDKSILSSIQQHLDELRELQRNKVRWFYKDGKKWIPFNGKDSLEIEEAWQSIEKNKGSASETYFKPTVRGRLYEVDIEERVCVPMYWKVVELPTPILRGTWFKGSILPDHWEPIEEKEAEKIETGHQGCVRALGFGSDEVMDKDSPVMHMIRIGNGYKVEWHDINDIKLVNDSAGSRIAQKIGIGGSHTLKRGWHTDATVTDDLPEINHVIFLIHGIGQLMYQTGGIIHSAQKLREATEKARKKNFKDSFKNGRVEFFPVEWRSSLKLDEGSVEAITPSNVGGLRKIINETTMDIMYYTSSYFRNEIIKSMREQLNSIYDNFLQRNPDFEARGGKVSVISHSLGSVIFHDILINWNEQLLEANKQQADQNIAAEGRWSWLWGSGKRKEAQESSDDPEANSDGQANLREELRQAKNKVTELEARLLAGDNSAADAANESSDFSLRFKIENVFNIGSPLGVFLVLKGIRARDDVEQNILPSSVCSRYFNIYDPADPIAYRIEPLIYEHYGKIPPVKINQATKSSGNDRDELLVKKENAAAGWIKSWFSHAPKMATDLAGFHSDGKVDLPKSEMEKVEDLLKEKKALKHRLDYTLESGFVEYFSAITSHMSYWESQEFARFVLKTINDSEKAMANEAMSAIGL